MQATPRLRRGRARLIVNSPDDALSRQSAINLRHHEPLEPTLSRRRQHHHEQHLHREQNRQQNEAAAGRIHLLTQVPGRGHRPLKPRGVQDRHIQTGLRRNVQKRRRIQ